MKLTNKEAREYFKTGKIPQSNAVKKNKFNAKKKLYNGRLYDSTGEADYSAELDFLKKAGEVVKIEYQHPIVLKGIKGEHITTYKIDFRVTFSSGLVEYHEFKGKETALWRVKWKLAASQYPDYVFVLVKKRGKRFVKM